MINIQKNNVNEYFKWRLARYLHPVDHQSARVTKPGKDLARELDFKDIKFPVETKNILKIEKNNSIVISVFGYENKDKFTIYASKKKINAVNKNMLIYY